MLFIANMRIDTYNNYQKYSKPVFKSSFPVVHWTKEAKGGYAPAYNMDIIQKLQEIIVKTLNENPLKTKKTHKKTRKTVISPAEQQLNELTERAKDFLRLHISSKDVDYRNTPAACKNKVRSYYNRKYRVNSTCSPLSYIVTGNDVKTFDEKFSKPIGRAFRNAKQMNIQGNTPEILDAKDNYNRNGLKFVNDYTRRIKNNTGNTEVLHTKFEIIRNKETGNITDFRFIDANFLPEFGPGNPLERLKRK